MMRTVLVLALTVVGCGPGQSGGGNHPDGGGGGATLTSIDVAPPSASLTTTGGGAAATQQFTATGHFSDGHTEDISTQVAWSVSDPGIGSVTSGAFTGAATRGGVAKVIAGQGAVSGTADLTVKYVAARVSGDDGSTAPAGSAGLFNGTDDPTLAPPLAYPLDGALVPHNLGLLEVQWKKPAGAADLFEVSFSAPTLDYRVYTNAPNANGGRLSLTPDEWTSIADTIGSGSVAVKVRGVVTAAPGKVGSSAVVNLSIGAASVAGGIYYWSPTGAGANATIMRHSFGDTSGTATAFYAPNSGTRCVGCHVITRDGSKMAVTYDGGNGAAAIVGVPLLGNVLPESAGLKWNFAAYSPDGNRMVATSQGTLKIYDTSGGPNNGMVQQVLADGTPGHYASHPDWSSDGSMIVYVDVGAPNGNSEWSFSKGSLVVVKDVGMGMFGAPQKIVTSAGEDNYYPSFSPDNKWILFNRGQVNAYNDATAEAYVVSVDGAIGPIALGNANSTSPNQTNSWPRWNPFMVHEPTGDLMYFTFSSTRDYGIEILQPNPPTQQNPLQPQIWMAAFDPAKAAQNQDPSSTAFWMPFQDVKSHNHIAQWTATFIP
jgi:hypothetical protein